jgi:DNA-binding GntR family transcriptional regulator
MQMPADMPTFRVAAELLRTRIDAGWYRHDFPSEAALATELAIDFGTLRLALLALGAEGVIDYQLGATPRVPPPALAGLVALAPGQLMTVRMPTYAERHHHGIRDGVPLLVTDTTAYRADEFAVIGGGGGRSDPRVN